MIELPSAVIAIILGLVGLCLGSFVNALVWRLHQKRDFVRERSECTDCHHQLAWYDLVPVLSWLLLRGKCRYCHQPISLQYPLVELAVAAGFVVSYVAWPYGWQAAGTTLFGLWLIMIVLLAALAVYDLRWMLLPDKLTFPLIGLGLAAGLIYGFGIGRFAASDMLAYLATGVASLAGIYYVIYQVSRGAWIGFGDIKLGLAFGLAGGWIVGLLTLFLANLIGFLVIAPGLVSGKLNRSSRIPFGPFLIIGFVVAFLGWPVMAGWYSSLMP